MAFRLLCWKWHTVNDGNMIKRISKERKIVRSALPSPTLQDNDEFFNAAKDALKKWFSSNSEAVLTDPNGNLAINVEFNGACYSIGFSKLMHIVIERLDKCDERCNNSSIKNARRAENEFLRSPLTLSEDGHEIYLKDLDENANITSLRKRYIVRIYGEQVKTSRAFDINKYEVLWSEGYKQLGTGPFDVTTSAKVVITKTFIETTNNLLNM